MDDVVTLRLNVRSNVVHLTGPGLEIVEPHDGLTQALLDAIAEVHRNRRRHRTQRSDLATVPSMRATGRLLAEGFLPEAVTAEISQQVDRAARFNLVVSSDRYPGLPWEAITLAGSDIPLVIEPNVGLFRSPVDAHTGSGIRAGPLRIAVAVASPTDNGGPLLDYERELRDIEEAVRPAHHKGADLMVVRYATLSALHDCLLSFEPHILHISSHGGPGTLSLEDRSGHVDVVDADKFVREVLDGATSPELICLAACYTSAQAAPRDAIVCRHIDQTWSDRGHWYPNLDHRSLLHAVFLPALQSIRVGVAGRG